MEALHGLIELAYATALGEMSYDSFLAAANGVFGFGAAGIVASQPNYQGHYCVAADGVDKEACDRVERRYGMTAGVFQGGSSTVVPGAVKFREDMISTRQLQEQPYFDEFVRPHKLQDGAIVCLDRSEKQLVLVTFARPARSARRERQAEQLRALAPHMMRGMMVVRSLAQLELLRRAHQETLNLAPYPVVVYDNFGDLFAANRAAEQRLAGECGLRLGGDGLHALSTQDDRRLQFSIRAVIASTNSAGQALASTELRLTPGGRSRGCQVVCIPLPPAHYGPGRRPSVVVLVHDADAEVHIPAERLREMFGLTRAEASVALGIVRGRSLDQIALEQRNSIATVRNLLKRIYAKTGVSRQSELAVQLLRAPLQIDLASLARKAPETAQGA